jgi:hypothetical protein
MTIIYLHPKHQQDFEMKVNKLERELKELSNKELYKMAKICRCKIYLFQKFALYEETCAKSAAAMDIIYSRMY